MQLTAEITIDSEAMPVWDVLAAVSRYQEWNPFLCAVEGELRAGATLRVTLGASNGFSSRERVRVTTVAAGEELRFRGEFWRAGVIDSDFRIRLFPVEEGTRVVAGAEVSGWLANYTSSRRLTAIARGWVGMNEALKRRVERAR